MNKSQAFFLAALLTASPFALAHLDGMGEHCERKGSDHFTEADTNKDGFIDKAEAQAMQEKHFEEMDTNHDGKLSKEEMAACKHGGMHNAMHDKGSMGFQKADKDHDGTLTKDEAKALPHVSQHFDEIDADKDGTVDRDEVHNFMKNLKAK